MSELFDLEPTPRPALELARERLAEAKRNNEEAGTLATFHEQYEALQEVSRLEREELERRKSS